MQTTATSDANILDLSVPIHELPTWVYGLSVILLFVPIGLFMAVYGFWAFVGNAFSLTGLPLFMALIVTHEVVHAIGWKFASGIPWSAFKFGIAWRALAPYCHATMPMNVIPYRIGAALPGIVTGILPFIYALVTGNALWAFVSAGLIMGAVGDIYVLWTLRNIPNTAKVQDHSSNAGCIVYL